MKTRLLALSLISVLHVGIAAAQTLECPPIQEGGYTIHRSRNGCPMINPADANNTWEPMAALQRFDREYDYFVTQWKPNQLGIFCQLFSEECNAPTIMRRCPKHDANAPGYPEDCRPSQAPMPQSISSNSDSESQFWRLFNLLPSAIKNRVSNLLATLTSVISNYSDATVTTMVKLNQTLYSPLNEKLRRGIPLSAQDTKRLQDAADAFNKNLQIKQNNIDNRLATLRALLKFALPVSIKAFGDLNKDGSLDQAFVYSPSQQVVILLYHREYHYYYPTQVLSLPNAQGVALVDVNGDGKLDLVVRMDGFDIQLIGNGRGEFNKNGGNS